jgi:hypothetical protein
MSIQHCGFPLYSASFRAARLVFPFKHWSDADTFPALNHAFRVIRDPTIDEIAAALRNFRLR